MLLLSLDFSQFVGRWLYLQTTKETSSNSRNGSLTSVNYWLIHSPVLLGVVRGWNYLLSRLGKVSNFANHFLRTNSFTCFLDWLIRSSWIEGNGSLILYVLDGVILRYIDSGEALQWRHLFAVPTRSSPKGNMCSIALKISISFVLSISMRTCSKHYCEHWLLVKRLLHVFVIN